MNAWINLKFEHIIFIVYLVIESYLEKKNGSFHSVVIEILTISFKHPIIIYM